MAIRRFSAAIRLIALGAAALALAACQESSSIPKDIRPLSAKLTDKMRSLEMTATSPILIRIFKEESALEVWKQRKDGKYALLKTYQICKWSGVLGPKVKEGDRQAPEGFYVVTPAQMNPKSQYYLSFNIGYPNAFDRALARTGTHLMVHGACSSAGCYSMTDEDAGELFALARDAFRGGQTSFQIHAFPFRMMAENLARHRDDPNMPFWRMLKEGYDHFAVAERPPTIEVCDKRYVFNADAGTATFKASAKCPAYAVPESIATAVARKQAEDDKKFVAAVAGLEAEARKDAAEKSAAAEKAAEDARLAARPSPLVRAARWISGAKPEPESTPTASAVSPPIPQASPAAKSAAATSEQPATKVAAAPVAKKKPAKATTAEVAEPQPKAQTGAPAPVPQQTAKADAPAALATTPADAGTEPFPTGTEQTGSTSPPPSAVGTFVKKDFNWPDDEPVMTGSSAPILSPQLGEAASAN